MIVMTVERVETADTTEAAETDDPFTVVDEDAAIGTEPADSIESPEADSSDRERQILDAKLDHYRRINELNDEVIRAANAYEAKKGSAKAAKSHLEELQADLSALICRGPEIPDPQKKLPFPDEEGGTVADSESADSAGGADGSSEEADTDWQLTKLIGVLTLTPKQAERLEDAGIWTVGQFEHVRSGRNRDFPDGLRSIKGVGEKTVDKWENDIVEWLAKNAREQEPGDATEEDREEDGDDGGDGDIDE